MPSGIAALDIEATELDSISILLGTVVLFSLMGLEVGVHIEFVNSHLLSLPGRLLASFE